MVRLLLAACRCVGVSAWHADSCYCCLCGCGGLLCVLRSAGFISRLGRTGAFNLSVCAWVPCGIMLTSLACTMAGDEDAMQVGD